MTSKIEISHKSIIFVLVFLSAVWLVLEIRDILFLLFIAFIVMSALRPMTDFLEKRRIPKIVSILLLYVAVIALLTFIVSSLVPVLVVQMSRFISNFPDYVEIIRPYLQIDTQSLSQQFAPIGENIVKFTVGIFSNIVTTMTVLVFTFYLLLEHDRIEKYLDSILSKDLADRVIATIRSIEYSLGAWLRGELILMLFIGLLTYIGLSFLQVEYALPLAIIAGLLEIVPVIGPFVSGIPAVIVALTVSPVLALTTVALYFLIQQLENNLIVPVVMKKAVNLPPLITIIALMVGSRLAGVVGAILAIPILLMVKCLILGMVAGKSVNK